MVFSVTDYLELHIMALISYQKGSNRLSGHYMTLTSLLGENLH